jgi:hypothetical protein
MIAVLTAHEWLQGHQREARRQSYTGRRRQSAAHRHLHRTKTQRCTRRTSRWLGMKRPLRGLYEACISY